MSKQLRLTFNTATIYEAVKADTYITGEIDKASDAVKNASLAYNEQAGDDAYHERKLKRTLAGAVGTLEANLAEFVDSADGAISDNLQAVLDTGGEFFVLINVSSRFNSGLSFPIGQLAFQFITNTMIYLWWQAIKPSLAKDYLAYATNSLTNIRLCLSKTAPAVSSASYADITGEVQGGGSDDTINTVAAVAYANSKFEANWTGTNALKTAYDANKNLKITCSDENASLVAKIGDDVLFTVGYTPYSLSQSNYVAIESAIGAGTKVDFVAAEGTTINGTPYLIFTTKVAGS